MKILQNSISRSGGGVLNAPHNPVEERLQRAGDTARRLGDDSRQPSRFRGRVDVGQHGPTVLHPYVEADSRHVSADNTRRHLREAGQQLPRRGKFRESSIVDERMHDVLLCRGRRGFRELQSVMGRHEQHSSCGNSEGAYNDSVFVGSKGAVVCPA